MKRTAIALSVMTLVCLSTSPDVTSPAQAAPAGAVAKSTKQAGTPVTLPSTDTSGANIFSVPGEEQSVATFIPSEEPAMKRQGKGNGNARRGMGKGRSDMPNLNQLKSLPSLTMQQRKQVVQLIKSTKAETQPLQQQLQKLQGNNGAGNFDRRTAMQLRTQVQSKRKATFEKLKVILTPQQFAELDAMKRGELQPATFAAPMVGGNRFAVSRNQPTVSSGNPMKEIEE